MHIYKYAQSHIILDQQLTVTLVTISRVSCEKNTINMQRRGAHKVHDGIYVYE